MNSPVARSSSASADLSTIQPISWAQEAHLITIHLAGKHTTAEIAELFGVARSTVCRTIKRAGESSE